MIGTHRVPGHCLNRSTMCQRYQPYSVQACGSSAILKAVANSKYCTIRRMLRTSSKRVKRCSCALHGSTAATSSPSRKLLLTSGVQKVMASQQHATSLAYTHGVLHDSNLDGCSYCPLNVQQSHHNVLTLPVAFTGKVVWCQTAAAMSTLQCCISQQQLVG